MNIAHMTWTALDEAKTRIEYPTLRTLIAFFAGVLVSAFALPDAVRAVSVFNIYVDDSVVVATEREHPLPTSIRIPAASIEADFAEALGVDESGHVEVPKEFDTVGWYKHGPVPGENGPAVVLGHVDSRTGPAVFYRLGQIEKGDEVLIRREDGSTLVYVVTELERPLQDEFPTEKVYGNIGYAGLRLITCTGTYDRAGERYSHNLIVYAQLKRTERP